MGITQRQIVLSTCNDAKELETQTSSPDREVIALIIGGNGHVVQFSSSSDVVRIEQVLITTGKEHPIDARKLHL